MRAWHVEAPGPVTGHPLRLHPDDEVPRPGPGELLLRVLACGATVHVLTRGEQAKQLARELGAASVGDADGMPPEPLDAAILFAPVGELVLPAMAALDRGGTLSIAGIHLTDIPPLNYEKHLFQERQLRSVTSNTRADAREFLGFAAEHKLAVTVHPYPLDTADQALRDLKAGRFDGAAVLIP